MESTLRQHSVQSETALIIDVFFSEVVHFVWLITIKIKVHVDKIIDLQVISHIDILVINCLHYFNQVYLELTFNPVLAQPTVFKAKVLLYKWLIIRNKAIL